MPPVVADASGVVWAIDIQFDCTIDGKAIKIASMVDEPNRELLLNQVERTQQPAPRGKDGYCERDSPH